MKKVPKIETVFLCSKSDGKKNSYRCSGLLINERFVITTGIILIPFLQNAKKDAWEFFGLNSNSKLNIFESLSNFKIDVWKEINEKDFIDGVHKSKLSSETSRLVALWKCPLVKQSLTNVFFDWTVEHGCTSEKSITTIGDNDEIRTSKELLSIFVILELEKKGESLRKDDKNVGKSIISTLTQLENFLMRPVRGEEVKIISTPFGNDLFINSVSLGIISNLVGIEKCLILTDARTVPGCEGAPIFASIKPRCDNVNNNLLGLVVCPLTWCKGEWVGFTIGVNLFPILNELLGKNIKKVVGENFTKTFISDLAINPKIPQDLDEIVVLVCNNNIWGSGIVLNSRTVLTCAHVLKNGSKVSVFFKKKHHSCEIIYKTDDDVPYDLGLIQTENEIFTNFIKFSKEAPVIGDEVIAVGFPFFSEKYDLNIRPSLSQGCISLIKSHMIQTTCCIQSGYSGGPLLKNGQLIGVVVSNTRDSGTGAHFPHINFVISSTAFEDVILKYLETNNVQFLQKLKVLNPTVRDLWSIRNSKL